MLELERILVPIDFSATSDRALDYAVDLAKITGASVTVMHAYEVPTPGVPDVALAIDITTRIVREAQIALASAIAEYEACGVPLVTTLREGSPPAAILHAAEDVDADLIIIGTHGRRGLPRALLGSVAVDVLRSSARPVLTLHPHDTPLGR